MNGLAAFSMTLVLCVPQQGQLVELARRNGGKAGAAVDINAPIATFDAVTKESQLIVRGIVRRVTTRLSGDGEFVVTDFEITPLKFYKGTVANIATAPGPTKPLVVERLGGVLRIDGLELSTSANQFPEKESLREGEEVFLFLSRDPSTTDFVFTDGAYGAYRIGDGRVTAMTKRTARDRGEQPEPFAAFESRVLGLAKK
jgi:hypothetical protein